MNRRIMLILRTGISAALMAALIYMTRESVPKMIEALAELPFYVFPAGLALFFASIVIASFRLRILLSAQGIKLNIAKIAKLTLLGYFFSSFLPTSVGGDVVKALYISSESKKPISSYTAVFMDRFLGMSTIFLMATVALLLSARAFSLRGKWLLPALLGASVLTLAFFFDKRMARKLSRLLGPMIPGRLKKKLQNIYEAMHNFKGHKSAIAGSALISIAGQITAFSSVYVFGLGLGSHIPFKVVLLAMPIASIVSMVPSLYGTGPREAAVLMILSPFMGREKALAIALLWLGVLLATAFAGGIIYGVMGLKKRPVVKIPEKGIDDLIR